MQPRGVLHFRSLGDQELLGFLRYTSPTFPQRPCRSWPQTTSPSPLVHQPATAHHQLSMSFPTSSFDTLTNLLLQINSSNLAETLVDVPIREQAHRELLGLYERMSQTKLIQDEAGRATVQVLVAYRAILKDARALQKRVEAAVQGALSCFRRLRHRIKLMSHLFSTQTRGGRLCSTITRS